MTTSDINLYPELEQVSQHFYKGTLPLGETDIILVEVNAYDMETIQHWIDFSADVRRDWDENKPMYLMIDTSKQDLPLNRRIQNQLQELSAIRPHLKSYAAWLIPKSIMGSLIKTGLMVFNHSSKTSQALVFYSREEGYEWLGKMYEKAQPVASDDTKSLTPNELDG